MSALWERPFRLAPNRVEYLLPGGELIDRFLGDEPGSHPGASQLWVASVVQCALENAPDTRSAVLRQDGGGVLAEALASSPAEFLGAENAAAFGPNPGFLLKLLHSTQRLLVQTHPTREKAQQYFGWPYGKTEAWYVLDVDRAAGPAYVWVGFKPGVGPEEFRALIGRQDTEGILACLHRFEIRPGDVVFIPAGLPHALGAGSLVAEIQEPSDITLRAERIRPDGSELPPESLHGGAGMDALLDCFDFSWVLPADEVKARCFLHPARRPVPGATEEVLIGPDQTLYFGLSRLVCSGPCARKNDPFRVLLAERGEGWLEAGGERLPLRRGTEVFVPHGVKEYTLVPQGGLTVLECAPPRASTLGRDG